MSVKFIVICHSMGSQENPLSDPNQKQVLGPFDTVAEAQSQEFYPSCVSHKIVVANEED